MTENLTIKGLIPVAEVRYKVMDYYRYIYLYIQCMQKIIFKIFEAGNAFFITVRT